MTIQEKVRELKRLKEAAKAAKDEYTDRQRESDRFERELFEEMSAQGIQSIKVDANNFVCASTPYGQIQDREAFVEWAHENAPELLEDRERKALVNELVKEALDSGQELPPGVGFYVKNYVSVRTAQ